MFKCNNYLAAYLMVYLSCSIELSWQRRTYHKYSIGIDAGKPLYCYSCNANAEFCAPRTLDLNRLRVEHYVPCSNGRCMQYRNKNDNQGRKLNPRL